MGTTYNVAGQPTGVSLGSGDNQAFTYDPNTFRMTKYQFNINGTQSFIGALGWNPNGTLATLGITDPFNAADTQSCTYSHDDLTRVASVNCGAAKWQQNFGYDAFGNLTKTVPAGGTGNQFQPIYSAATNRMTNIAGFVPTYDSDGNTLNDNFMVRTWDAESILLNGSGHSVTIDALGRAIDSGFTTATFYSPDGSFHVAYAGQLARRGYLKFPGGGFATYDESNGGLFEYDHPDNLGSSRLATTPTRTFTFSKAFAPFGDVYASSLVSGSFFTGVTNFFNLNSYEFRAREYNDYGRWASPDPAGLTVVSLENPQSFNRYSYVWNNPLRLADPLGLCPSNGICTTVWAPYGSGGYWGTMDFGGALFSEISAVAGRANAMLDLMKHHRKNITFGVRAPNQTYKQCMEQHAQDYSMVGAADLTVDWASNNKVDSHMGDTFEGSLLGGNNITGLVFGDTKDAALAGGGNSTDLLKMGMGSQLTFGRRTTDIMSMNLAGTRGGPPLALSAATTNGTKSLLSRAGTTLNLGMETGTRWAVDAALTGAEAIGCAIPQ